MCEKEKGGIPCIPYRYHIQLPAHNLQQQLMFYSFGFLPSCVSFFLKHTHTHTWHKLCAYLPTLFVEFDVLINSVPVESFSASKYNRKNRTPRNKINHLISLTLTTCSPEVFLVRSSLVLPCHTRLLSRRCKHAL